MKSSFKEFLGAIITGILVSFVIFSVFPPKRFADVSMEPTLVGE